MSIGWYWNFLNLSKLFQANELFCRVVSEVSCIFWWDIILLNWDMHDWAQCYCESLVFVVGHAFIEMCRKLFPTYRKYGSQCVLWKNGLGQGIINASLVNQPAICWSWVNVVSVLMLKTKYSWLSLSRPRLSRITAYLEVKIWSLPIHENLTTDGKYCRKEEKLLLRSNFSSFPQYFQYISNFKSPITYQFVKCA